MDKENKILNQFIKRYVDENKINTNKMIWNSLKSEVVPYLSTYSFGRLKTVISRLPKLVCVYDERSKELNWVSKSDICKMIEEKDEWMDYDLIVFDNTTDWFIAITHEDIILAYGEFLN